MSDKLKTYGKFGAKVNEDHYACYLPKVSQARKNSDLFMVDAPIESDETTLDKRIRLSGSPNAAAAQLAVVIRSVAIV